MLLFGLSAGNIALRTFQIIIIVSPILFYFERRPAIFIHQKQLTYKIISESS